MHAFFTPSRIARWSLCVAFLLLPWIAMRFTSEVQWDAADFVFAGTLIVGVNLAYELALRASASRSFRLGAALALLTGLALLWANAAVGLIGSEDNPANRAVFGVLAVAIAATLLARGRPRRMAWAMLATALAQAGMALLAIVMDASHAAPFILAFSAPWLVCAWLFRRAAP